MVLITIGTNEQPFDRLIQAAAELPGPERLVVQHGSSAVRGGRGQWVDYLSFEDLTELLQEARAVVCHAGVGSIMLARRHGHRPVVVPRRAALHEAVDDHQLALAQRLAQAGAIRLVEDEHDLPDVLSGIEPGHLRGTDPVHRYDVSALAGEIRSFLGARAAAH